MTINNSPHQTVNTRLRPRNHTHQTKSNSLKHLMLTNPITNQNNRPHRPSRPLRQPSHIPQHPLIQLIRQNQHHIRLIHPITRQRQHRLHRPQTQHQKILSKPIPRKNRHQHRPTRPAPDRNHRTITKHTTTRTQLLTPTSAHARHSRGRTHRPLNTRLQLGHRRIPNLRPVHPRRIKVHQCQGTVSIVLLADTWLAAPSPTTTG